MADLVVQFFADKLTSLLQEEANLLGGVRQDAQYMRDELARMTAFLRDVDARQLREGSDPQLKVSVSQVRDVAYDIEDVLDEFILRLQHHHDVEGFYGSLRRICFYVNKLKARHQIASQIRSLKVRVGEIAEGCQRYPLDNNFPQQSSSSNVVAVRIPYDVQREVDLVGIEKPKQQLVEWLLNRDSKLQCISVVGMGGLGKTTLVKKVYHDPSVKKHFQSHLWLVVSQASNLVELLKQIVRQLSNKIGQPLHQGVESMRVNELKGIIDNVLQQRRFLVVIDNVWSISVWEDVRKIVPVNDCGSRLMLTTRKINVASKGEYTLNLKPLSQEESWTLFCRKAFPESCLRPPHLQAISEKECCLCPLHLQTISEKGSCLCRPHLQEISEKQSCLCPPHLQAISEKILSRCEGLPLAIVVIAGVLATKDRSRIKEWVMFEQSLPSVWGIHERLERVKRLLFLSYYDLPDHLKICFLYMSLFPEDEEMEKMRLIRLWIAEGLVQARTGMSIEDVAEEYHKELINRSLVQVGGDILKDSGRLRTCRIHDLLRKMILSIATEHKFIMVASGTSNEWPERVRRIAIHEDAKNLQVSRKYFNRLRSFLSFSRKNSPSMSKLPLPILLSSKFLKVLDLRNAQLHEIPQEIFGLVHLRYLSLRGTDVRTIPKMIGNLEKLETLDLKYTLVDCVPEEIVKLVRLRHLLACKRYSYLNGFKAPSNIGALFSFQTLCKVNVCENHEVVLREIGRLSELRKLGIVGLRREDGMTLCSSLSKLTNLRSLYLQSNVELLNVESLPALKFLEIFTLRGPMDKTPDWKSFPCLIKVKLEGCRLKDWSDLLTDSIQDLPNLQRLVLSEASHGDSLCFKAAGFQRLTYLSIESSYGLKRVTIEGGAMPHLDTLKIWSCFLLDVLPSGIEYLRKLRCLQLCDMPTKLIESKDKEHRDHWRIAHVPEVVVSDYNFT